MPSLRDIRRRIASVKNTQQITNAMKMVSAAKLQRAQDRVLAARPYSQRLRQVLEHLDARVRPDVHPLLTPRDGGKTLLVLVTSDRGLCGGFNGNVQRAAVELLGELGGNENVDIITIGRKGRDFLTYRRYAMQASYMDLFTRQVAYEQAVELAATILAAYEGTQDDAEDDDYGYAGYADEASETAVGYKSVLVLYNRFGSAVHQVVTTLQLLPMSGHTTTDAEPAEPFDFIYEPSAEAVLDSLLRREVDVQLFQVLLESFAGEHGARMTAMDSATENASEMIASLTLTFNRARQAAITKELIEVVSGADAL
jgi:F-type H+-transporting ATPase subunit gamma